MPKGITTSTMDRCDAVNCSIPSKSYLNCIGCCGKKIHSICGGISRTNITTDSGYGNYFKYVCNDCEGRFTDSIQQHTEIKTLLNDHANIVGTIANQVKQLQRRVDSSEEYIDDIDQSLQSLEGNGLSNRIDKFEKLISSQLKRIEDVVNSLNNVDKPSCVCGDVLVSFSDLITQLEKNINQSFEKNVKEIVHSLHSSLHSSFLASANNVVSSVSNNVSILIEDKLDEFAAMGPVNLSNAFAHTQSQTSIESNVAFNHSIPLSSELSHAEFDSRHAGSPSICDTDLNALHTLNGLASLINDFNIDICHLTHHVTSSEQLLTLRKQNIKIYSAVPVSRKKKYKPKKHAPSSATHSHMPGRYVLAPKSIDIQNRKKTTNTAPVEPPQQINLNHNTQPSNNTWIYISGLGNAVNTDILRDYVGKRINCNDIICSLLLRRGTDPSSRRQLSFKMRIPSTFAHQVLNPYFWPSHVTVRSFVDLSDFHVHRQGSHPIIQHLRNVKHNASHRIQNSRVHH